MNTKELTDVTNQYLHKITYGDNNSAVIDFGNADSAYVVMVNTKFQYTTSESPTLVQMVTLSSDKKYIKLVTTYGKILIKTVFKN